MTSELRLGDAVNLLHGLRPAWVDSVRGGRPFSAPPQHPLTAFEMDASTDEPTEWSGPELSLHDTVDELVNEIFDYRVAAFTADPGAFCIPASTLMLASEDRRQTLVSLGELLGIDLASAETCGFILVKMQAAWCRTSDMKRGKEESASRASTGITGRGGTKCDGTPSRCRAHLRGDGPPFRRHRATSDSLHRLLLQLRNSFCLAGDIRRLDSSGVWLQTSPVSTTQGTGLAREARGTRVSGPLVHGLRFCTSPYWVSARGTIVSATGDAALSRALQSGMWRDQEFAGGDSLLAPPAGDARAWTTFCRQFTRVVPITIEFSAQNLFMEGFRGCALAENPQGGFASEVLHGRSNSCETTVFARRP